MKTKESILQEKLDGWIQRNQSHNETQLGIMVDDMERTTDYIKRSGSFRFKKEDDNLLMGFQDGANFREFRLIDNSFNQLADRNKIPIKYLKELINGDGWMRELGLNILKEHAENRDDRLLIRAVGDDIRGILSDQYRRLNSFSIYSSFIERATEMGAILTDTSAGITRGFIEMIIPKIRHIELPNNGNVAMAFGLQLRNSDFGRGATELRTFLLQVICLNGATGKSLMREIHLGARLPENILLSQKTYELDSQRTESILMDTLVTSLSEEGIQEYVNSMVDSSKKIITNPKEYIGELPKMGLTIPEASGVENYLMSGSEDDGIQGKPSLWKFAQAIGAVARHLEDHDRKRDLYDVAGNLIFGTN